MLDFYADWCVSCKEMEKLTFVDQRVQHKLGQHAAAAGRRDGQQCDDKAHAQALLSCSARPESSSSTPSGREIRGCRVIGYQDADKFLASLSRLGMHAAPAAARTKQPGGSRPGYSMAAHLRPWPPAAPAGTGGERLGQEIDKGPYLARRQPVVRVIHLHRAARTGIAVQYPHQPAVVEPGQSLVCAHQRQAHPRDGGVAHRFDVAQDVTLPSTGTVTDSPPTVEGPVAQATRCRRAQPDAVVAREVRTASPGMPWAAR